MLREKIDTFQNFSTYNDKSYFPWDIAIVYVQPTARGRSVILNKNGKTKTL